MWKTMEVQMIRRKKKTHEEFIEELLKIRDDIILLDKYVNSSTQMRVRCKVCGHEWKTLPPHLKNNTSKCKKCATAIIAKKLSRSHEDFVSRIYSNTDKIEVLGRYINSKTKLLCRCRDCNNEWFAYPNNLLSGGGCPKCRIKEAHNKTRKTHDYFIRELNDINPNIEVIDKYKGALSNVTCRCKKCNYMWETKPNSLLSNKTGCPRCRDSYKRTHKEFIEEMSIVSPKIKILGSFTKVHDNLLCECVDCHTQWMAAPLNLLKGSGCPCCSNKESRGERKIRNYLETHCVSFEPQKKFTNLFGDKNKLSYDFYIKDKNLLIEYQGQQHYYPIDWFGGDKQFSKQQEYDSLKREYAKNNKIRLLEISYEEYEKIESILDREIFDIYPRSVAI